MAQSTQQGDYLVTGALVANSVNSRTGSITDAMIAALAGLQASKLQHQYEPEYAQTFASNATVERKVVHVVRGASATLVEFQVGASTAAIGAATATIDLLKNGSTMLTAAVSLTSATAAFALLAGTLASTALVAGDVLEVNVSAAVAGGGTLAKGLFAEFTIREDAQ